MTMSFSQIEVHRFYFRAQGINKKRCTKSAFTASIMGKDVLWLPRGTHAESFIYSKLE